MYESYGLQNKRVNVSFIQMYNYIKLGFNLGYPHDWSFEIDLTVNDIDLIIRKLSLAKKELQGAKK